MSELYGWYKVHIQSDADRLSYCVRWLENGVAYLADPRDLQEAGVDLPEPFNRGPVTQYDDFIKIDV